MSRMIGLPPKTSGCTVIRRSRWESVMVVLKCSGVLSLSSPAVVENEVVREQEAWLQDLHVAATRAPAKDERTRDSEPFGYDYFPRVTAGATAAPHSGQRSFVSRRSYPQYAHKPVA